MQIFSKTNLFKLIGLISVARVYNVLVLVIAQIFAAVFIFNATAPLISTINDVQLWLIVVASACAITGGYIVNNFYDREKDLINRPQKTLLEQKVFDDKLWILYFTLNFISFGLGLLVSLRAGLFFAIYIFLLWFYSHKLKKITYIGDLMAAFVAILPFFAIFVYYKNFSIEIFFHAIFLFLILLTRELVKDFENLKGDLVLGYKTLPVALGMKLAKYNLIAHLLITALVGVLMGTQLQVGDMKMYFFLSSILLITNIGLVGSFKVKKQYLFLHNQLKLLIVLGVFCIVLIRYSFREI
ncbi:MAG: geranylgeranylglycerol-phosphate geranylgeranyltransferase, partial [Flavobacteriaceae bacterium]|nr:geranylgeranylglycerol-phosphate geranylgeranyltransferase [Flavobacteriaceae bacterium]